MMFLVYMILALAAAMILSVLLMRAGMIVAVRRAGSHIEEALRLIEHITTTRTVPQSWREPFVKKLARVQRRHSENKDKQTRIRQGARKTCLKKLTKLITYAQNSPFLGDEETRQSLIAELKAVYEEWKSQEWEGMAGRQ